MRRFPIAFAALALIANAAFGGTLSAVAAKASFQKQHPDVKFYNNQGRIARVYGPEFATGNTPRDAAEEFINRDAAMFGVKPGDLQRVGEQDVMDGKFTTERYTQSYNGVPVHNGVLILLSRTSKSNGIVLASNYLYNLSDAKLGKVVTTGQQAIDRWKTWYPNFTFTAPELSVYVPGEGVPTYAWKFVGGNNSLTAPEKYTFLVDATKASLPIIGQETLIMDTDVTGNVNAWATPGDLPDTASNPETQQVLTDLQVQVQGGNSAYTDASGNFTITNAGTSAVTVNTGLGTLGGRWSKVADQSGATVLSLNLNVTPPGPANFLYNPPAQTDITTAQVNAYKWVTNTHNYVKAISATYPIDMQMPTNVNIASTCNAYFDGGSVNFYQAGGGCPNTAYSSVVSHEYGHFVIQSGGSGQGAYGEGVADTTACLELNSPCVGNGFQGSGCLRSAYNSINYPVDSYEIHTGGECILGAFWLTHDALQTFDPVNYLTIIRKLYLNSILVHSGTSIDPSITIDVLTLDDDNGDISDGTPHYNQIAQGFNAKNLTAPPLNLIKFTFPNGQPSTILPDGTTKIRVQVDPISQTPQPGTGKLFYNVNGGSYTQVAMSVVSANVYDAVFPILPCGSSVSYYFSAQTTTAATATSPSDAPTTVYSTYVAYGLTSIFTDNFQTNKGWTVQNGSGLSTGAWVRGTPVIQSDPRGTPQADYDGSGQCYLTDNRAGDFDVDGGTTWLISPAIDMSAGDGVVSYARWYDNSYGSNPHTHTFVVYVSNNNGTSWTTAETVGPATQADGGWFTHSFRVGQFVTPTNQVKIRVEASDSSASAAVVEAAVDAVSVNQFICSVPSSLSGNVNLQNWSPSPAGQAVTINFYTPSTSTLIASYPTTLDGSGNYNIASVMSGAYDIKAKGANWLQQKLALQVVNGATVANFSLINGDADGNNVIDLFDLNLMLLNFGGSGSGDINGDGTVDLFDLNISFFNFGLAGD